jgi:SAM-dependent methyltransferase
MHNQGMADSDRYQDYVIKNGEFIGDFEALYQKFDDPWNQSRTDHVQDSRRQLTLVACNRLRDQYSISRVVELGCGFGYLTNELRKQGFYTVGTDISPTSIRKAKEMNPESSFAVASYDDFELLTTLDADLIIMAELTWYVLESLDDFLIKLKHYATNRENPTFLIHLLTTYEVGKQLYGRDKFTTLEEVLKYFNLKYLEYGFIHTVRIDDPVSQGTYFIAKVE